MGLRDRILQWLDRGDPPEEGDPDAVVEVASVSILDGPRLLAALAGVGIDASGVDSTTDALHGSARTRTRILVRRADADRALEVIEDHQA